MNEGEGGATQLTLGRRRDPVPRRYGKTSLVRAVLAAGERDGHPTVYVNFYGILSVEDAIARLELGYRGLKGRLAEAGSSRVRSLRPASVSSWGVIEQHGTQVGYLFAGSHPGMMRGLFADRERPFYGQERPGSPAREPSVARSGERRRVPGGTRREATPRRSAAQITLVSARSAARSVPLGPLADEDLAPFIAERFEATDRDAGAALGPLLDLVRGHPQRAMLSAHLLWERTPHGGAADEQTFGLLLGDLEDELGEAFAGLWQGLSDSDRRALVAVASAPGSPTGKQALGQVGLARETARDAIERLLDVGHVAELGGRLVVTDPLLDRWLAGGRIGLG